MLHNQIEALKVIGGIKILEQKDNKHMLLSILGKIGDGMSLKNLRLAEEAAENFYKVG